MRATKLVCTLGPATAGRVPDLVRLGMDVARINCSHGTRDDHQRLLGEVRRAADAAGRAVGVMADLSGPKVRLGELDGGQVTLERGGRFELRPDGPAGNAAGAAVSYPRLGEDLERGDRVLLADGAVELRVVEGGAALVTEVLRGGTVRSRAGVNIPSERLGLPAITEKDREDVTWALEADVDLVAQSFVRAAADVVALRRLLGERPPLVVAKLETRPAVEDADAILAVSDGAIVARGDLGVEASIEEIPVLEKDVVARARRAGVPVIVATQMLESMVSAPRPTRAEASDVANAVFEGADAILLSAETAIGRYPVEATATAGRIARVAETAGRRFMSEFSEGGGPPRSDSHAVARSAAEIARDGGAVVVACFTRTGRTAALLAAARPGVPILALSTDEHVVRGLTLHRAVLPQACRPPRDTDEMIRTMDRRLRDAGLARAGEATVLVASIPFGEARTNLLKLHRVGS